MIGPFIFLLFQSVVAPSAPARRGVPPPRLVDFHTGSIDDDLHPAWYLIIFGGFGFLFDCICMYCFSIWGDPEEMGLGAKGAPAAADVEGGAPGAPDTMQPKMSKVRSAAVHGTEVAEKKASAMNMCGQRLGV